MVAGDGGDAGNGATVDVVVEAAVRKLTKRLLDVQPDDLSAAVAGSLAELCEAFDVDRGYLLTTEPRTLQVGMLEEWWRPDIERVYATPIPELPIDAQRFWARNLRKGNAVHLPDLDDIPVEAEAAAADLRAADVVSILMLPLIATGGTVGFVGFEARRHRVSWSDRAIELLRTVGEMLVITLDRCRAETALQQAVSDLAQRNRDLERSNRDLEQFASIVSHDLKSPLMLVEGYVDLLANAVGRATPEEAAQFAAAARRGVARMEHLIDDLLAYSRAGAGRGETATVVLDDIVNDAVADLQTQIVATNATINLGALPTVEGDRTQLRQLLQNLIANAIKFHQPDASPHVELSATVDDGLCHLVVADDGIGIEAARRSEIFEMFNRGPSPGAPGSGIGLAIAARVVANHNASIWVEDNPGGGTRVCVDLPLRAAAE